MYRSYTADHYRKYFGLPDDYAIDAILVSGTFSLKLELPKIKSALESSNIKYELKLLPGYEEYGKEFFGQVTELHISGKVIWYFVAYGGALLSEYLHFGYLFGAQKTVLVGTCGGLKKEAESNEIVIPVASRADGSTSYMYDRTHKELQQSDESLSKKIVEGCDVEKLKTHRGKTMTCQAMVAETWEDVEHWSEDGYIGVEMEASTVFAVSNHFQKPSAAILSIADNLIKEESNVSHKFHVQGELRKIVKEKQYKIAIKVLLED